MLTQTFRSRFRTLRYVESFPHSLFHSSFINSPLSFKGALGQTLRVEQGTIGSVITAYTQGPEVAEGQL